MSALVTLGETDARLDLAPATGGAIAAFSWRGVPLLRSTAPQAIASGDVHAHACWPLVPYSNRIACGRLRFAGKEYRIARNFGEHPHAIHGVGWQRAWRVASADARSALLAYEHDPAASPLDAEAWPWPFCATQWFQLAAAGAAAVALRMRLGITNTGEAPFPFGLGWHPYFPRDAATVLGFVAQSVWQTDATILPTRQVPVLGDFSFAPARPIGATALDNVYSAWAGEADLHYPDAARATQVRGDTASRHLVCYIPRGDPWLAIEPVTHMTDAFNRAELGEADTGARVLGPGESFSCTMEISARALP